MVKLQSGDAHLKDTSFTVVLSNIDLCPTQHTGKGPGPRAALFCPKHESQRVWCKRAPIRSRCTSWRNSFFGDFIQALHCGEALINPAVRDQSFSECCLSPYGWFTELSLSLRNYKHVSDLEAHEISKFFITHSKKLCGKKNPLNHSNFFVRLLYVSFQRYYNWRGQERHNTIFFSSINNYPKPAVTRR